jgi:hypothetical protein
MKQEDVTSLGNREKPVSKKNGVAEAGRGGRICSVTSFQVIIACRSTGGA